METGEAMKQIADIKYSLDDSMKQNFLEPLHHLQSKELKEVMVSTRRESGLGSPAGMLGRKKNENET